MKLKDMMWRYRAKSTEQWNGTEHFVVKERAGVERLVATCVNATEAKSVARACNALERSRFGIV